MNNLACEAPPEAGIEPVSEDGLRIPEAIYWRDYYLEADIHYEWNDGRLEEKPVSDYETYLVYAWFAELLRHFLRTNPIASMVALEMGFRLPLPGGTVIRKPDLGVVRKDNRQPLLPLDCSYHGVFDLCIEALSDKERAGIERDTVTKRREYARGGVSEYYILHRERKYQRFFCRDNRGVYVPLDSGDGIIHSRVLPGFRFRAEDLQRQPGLEMMCNDELYRDFVLPEWREEVQARESAEQREREEAQARTAAEQRERKEAQARREEAQARKAAEQWAAKEAEARKAAEEEIERLRALLEQRAP